MGWYAGIDLGATNTRALIADDSGAVAGRDRRATPQGPTGQDITDAVVDTLEAACGDAGIDPDDLAAVGIGSMGPLDVPNGALDDPPNLAASVGTVPLVEPVRAAAGGAPVSLWNDAVAGVLGERRFGAGGDDLVYLTISSGIGAGVALDGHVPCGWNGNVAEVGHFVVDPDGRRTCGCGGAGHWEAYCAGAHIPAFARDVAADLVAGSDSDADRDFEADSDFEADTDEAGSDFDGETDLPLGDPDFDAADVFAAAGSDPVADRVVERMGRYNAIGVANTVHAFAPRRIVCGGAVVRNNPDAVLGPIRERVPSLVATEVPTVTVTDLGDDAVALGALAGVLPDG